ncbi:MAG TPA: hypothetical protein DCG57_17260 [Candidatus Riflebacteria bacterium]|nr:hypothetical protein [Candidatus Riflebacteria bacterium]
MKPTRILCAVILLCSLVSTVWASSDVARDQGKNLSRLERYIYGDEQKGGEAERLRQIEEDLFGRNTGRKDAEKTNYLHDFVFKGSPANPSLDMKLSFLEWRLFNRTGEGNLETRLADIDKQVIGSVSMEPLAFRLEQQIHLIIENGLISLHQVTIPRGTEIKMRLKKDISSRIAKKNDIIPMVLSHDVFIDNNILVMTNGGIVTSSVKSVRRGGRFGRTGYVNLDVTKVESMDSTDLPIQIDAAGEKFDKRKIGMAAGASTLGYLVLGPIGLAGGAFIKGGEVEVPAGTEITVRTTEDCKVIGVLVNRK